MDEIEALSTMIHEAWGDVRCTCTKGDDAVGWTCDPDMGDEEGGTEERLHKWLAMNDEILNGLKENRDVEEGQERRYSLAEWKPDAAEDKADPEHMLKRMDGLISRGLDHVAQQRKRKLERAHTNT